MKKRRENENDKNLLPENDIQDMPSEQSVSDAEDPYSADDTADGLIEEEHEVLYDANDPDLLDDPDMIDESEELFNMKGAEEESWTEVEPVDMQLGKHEIRNVIDDDDPDAPIFSELSTRPSDAVPTERGKKANWKPRMFLIIMAVIALLILIWSVISLGNLNERMSSPLTVGNREVSNAEFSFMYHYVLLENGVDIFKENTETMLQEPGENGFATYREYFLDVTAKEIQATDMLYDDAVAHGYSITSEHKDRAQAYIDWLKTKADAIHVDLDTYIKGTFGPYVNKSLILSVLPKVYFAEDYSGHQKLEELKATSEQAEQAYQNSRNSYDLVSYRMLRITYEQREESYVKTANIHAQKIIDDTNGDQTKFEACAATHFSGEMQQRLLVPDSTLHAKVRYSEVTETEWKNWLFDTSRKPGDCVIIPDDYGFPVIFCFVERTRQEEPLRNVRFFYINMEDEETGAPGVPRSDILVLSQTIFDSITDEASMITLETTYADELMDGSMRAAQQTSLYPGQNPAEIDEWIFDPERKAGDKTLLQRENDCLILFYVGASPNPEWYDRVNSFIRMDNYQEFISSNIGNYAYTFHEEGLKYIEDIPS
ncbi:MAG: hypothetical protein K6A81_06235 [Clostridiales bacterium]|nr:hypothetical protein [Clostridiales bacterium]